MAYTENGNDTKNIYQINFDIAVIFFQLPFSRFSCCCCVCVWMCKKADKWISFPMESQWLWVLNLIVIAATEKKKFFFALNRVFSASLFVRW